MDTPWRIELLGRICALQEGLSLTRFRTQKTALLLARLALFSRRSHSREELADLLWPEASQEAGRNNLKQSLATLRRLIEPPGTPRGSILIATRSEIRLNSAAIVTDVAEFEQAVRMGLRSPDTASGTECLRQAVALYSGELLPGFYDEWVLEERDRLAFSLDEVQSALAQTTRSSGVSVSAAVQEDPFLPSTAALPDARPLRLPLAFTRFFGRASESEEIGRLLQDPHVRLLTLTGPGGAGKTRLALEMARQTAEHYSRRVYFAPLADLKDTGLICRAVADALRLPAVSEIDPLEQIAAALTDTKALLVLDNLEQFAAASAPVVLALLNFLPGLTILATSRQRLFVAGEQEVPIGPLPVPAPLDPRVPPSPETLRLFPSVLLFADRARLARPDFQITVRNAEAVAEISRRLEGLPLALELAAAWAALLTPAQMRDRLQERFSMLVSRTKDAAERHQTLWAAIEWSCCLLPPPLARFWRRLSVFRGGFTAEGAAEVCDEPQAADCLWQLRARSLVTLEETGETVQFRLLEMLREYGAAGLAEEEGRDLLSRYADYYQRLAQQAEPHLTGPDQGEWLHRLAQEQDNFRSVLRGDGSTEEQRLHLAGALWRFWSIRGPMDEGRRFLEHALQCSDDLSGTAAAAKALNGLAVLVRRQGDLDEAEEVQRRCLALWRDLEDVRGIASALNNLGTLTTLKGDFAAAEMFLKESLHLWRQMEQPQAIAQTLHNLGFLAQEQGNQQEARRFCTESLDVFRQMDSPQGKIISLTILAASAVALNEYECALPFCREVLEIAGSLDDSQAVITCLQLLADIRFAAGDLTEAVHLLGCAGHLRDQIGSFQDKRAQACVVRLIKSIQQQLPSETFSAAWQAGQSSSLDEAIALALEIISHS